MSIHAKIARNAITHYKVLKRFGDYTYIQCKLETGRTHQIRVHMASIGHPLLGDQVYGPKNVHFPKLVGQTPARQKHLDLSTHVLMNILK